MDPDLYSLVSKSNESLDQFEPIVCFDTECTYPFGPACDTCSKKLDEQEQAKQDSKQGRKYKNRSPSPIQESPEKDKHTKSGTSRAELKAPQEKYLKPSSSKEPAEQNMNTKPGRSQASMSANEATRQQAPSDEQSFRPINHSTSLGSMYVEVRDQSNPNHPYPRLRRSTRQISNIRRFPSPEPEPPIRSQGLRNQTSVQNTNRQEHNPSLAPLTNTLAQIEAREYLISSRSTQNRGRGHITHPERCPFCYKVIGDERDQHLAKCEYSRQEAERAKEFQDKYQGREQ